MHESERINQMRDWSKESNKNETVHIKKTTKKS
jgi:hypothetical protein